jgi:hypothetical protein
VTGENSLVSRRMFTEAPQYAEGATIMPRAF